jgi:methylmalonyl-CoA/ethylmalonyl-CoA epimerase
MPAILSPRAWDRPCSSRPLRAHGGSDKVDKTGAHRARTNLEFARPHSKRQSDDENEEGGPMPDGSLFAKIDHVGIAVPDLDAAIAFYRDRFGIVSVHEETNEGQGVREAMLAVGDGATRIQLLAPLNADSTIAKFIDRNGPGIQQLAYTVADIDSVSEQLRARGLRLLYDAPRRGTSNSRVNFIHPKDAGGVLVELVEHAADEN